MNSEIFKSILNYNKDHCLPRGIHKEHLIHFIKIKTDDEPLNISRKLDILFGIKNKQARRQMLFTLFLIISDSKIETLLDMNYKQSIPNKEQLDRIKDIGVKYYSNVESKTVNKALELVFNPSYIFEPTDVNLIEIEDISPVIEFCLLTDSPK